MAYFRMDVEEALPDLGQSFGCVVPDLDRHRWWPLPVVNWFAQETVAWAPGAVVDMPSLCSGPAAGGPVDGEHPATAG
ncbi:hypothetical protein ACFYT4_22250 [Streptomyces sp. NPDC004609]|uniref:hypothetical protein n=1 Tax=Streptomyces sp. NPDC004609 TaxID=3364704 RepID=UPI0036B8E1B8